MRLLNPNFMQKKTEKSNAPIIGKQCCKKAGEQTDWYC